MHVTLKGRGATRAIVPGKRFVWFLALVYLLPPALAAAVAVAVTKVDGVSYPEPYSYWASFGDAFAVAALGIVFGLLMLSFAFGTVSLDTRIMRHTDSPSPAIQALPSTQIAYRMSNRENREVASFPLQIGLFTSALLLLALGLAAGGLA